MRALPLPVDPAHDGGAAHRVSALQEPVLEYPENPPPQGEGMSIWIPFLGAIVVSFRPRRNATLQRLDRYVANSR